MYNLKVILLLVLSLQVDAKLRGGASDLEDKAQKDGLIAGNSIQKANALIAESVSDSSSLNSVRGLLPEISVACPTAISSIYQALGNADIRACATNADCEGFEPTDGVEACW